MGAEQNDMGDSLREVPQRFDDIEIKGGRIEPRSGLGCAQESRKD